MHSDIKLYLQLYSHDSTTIYNGLLQAYSSFYSHYLYSEIDKKSGNANNHSSRVSALLVPQVVDNRVGFA